MYSVRNTDILVIGGGGAGVTAAVLTARLGCKTALVSKEPMGRGDTCIASGFMTDGSANPSDNPQKLLRDLVICGEYLNDPVLVKILADRSHEATEVLEEFGMVFCRNKKGDPIPLPFPLGGHSVERSLGTFSEGNQIGSALRGALYSSQVKLYEEYLVTDLFTHKDRVTGALGIDLHSGDFVVFSAKAVILASGGCGWLYAPFTSNVKSNTGDGFILAFDAGAELRDMEHAQFTFGAANPYGMKGVLLGEPASAGVFGRLMDSEDNDIIDKPGKKTRGQVAAAMARTINAKKVGQHGGVFLNLSGNSRQMGPIYQKIMNLSRKSAIDAVRFASGKAAAKCEVPWEVVPTFHYLPGGVKVNKNCQSKIANLYAIGQVQGGLFGADRLGSVSLTELFLFGKIAAESAVESDVKKCKDSQQNTIDPKSIEEKIQKKSLLKGNNGSFRPIELKRHLQKIMWEKVGFIRNEKSLKEALHDLDVLDDQKKDAAVPLDNNYNTDWIDLIELGSMIKLSKIIARCALERSESRGGHYRTDFPEKDDISSLKTIIASKEKNELKIHTDPIMQHTWQDITSPGLKEKLRPAIQDFFIRNLPASVLQKVLSKKFGEYLQEK